MIPLLLLMLWSAGAPSPKRFENLAYTYDLFKGDPDCETIKARLKALPERPGLIISIEQGPEFLLDSPEGDARLACAAGFLHESSRSVKVMLLQDPIFLQRGEEAARRAALVAAFDERHPGLIAGVQVDVEPYTVERWGCMSVDDRRSLLRDLHALLSKLRQQLRGTPLGVVAPWWYPAVAKELPEAGPEQLFQVVDEIYLMAYGDEGGPLIGGSPERVLSRIDAPEFFTGRGRLYVALATYEFPAPNALDTAIEKITSRLAARPTFAGCAVFHANGPFNVPLQRQLSGTIVDPEGHPLEGVDIEGAGKKSTSGVCGGFGLGGLPSDPFPLTIHKGGYRMQTITVQPRAPGEVRELPKITLEKEQ